MTTPIYSFAVITPPPATLGPGETAIRITESTSTQNLHVAASVACTPGSDGNPVVAARVRVILPDGTPATDVNGNTVQTRFGVSVTPALLVQCTDLPTLQKCVLMTALGGDPGVLAPDPAVAANASIINRALSALSIQPVSVAALL